MAIFKRKGSGVWQIRNGEIRCSAGTDNEDAAKALEAKLVGERWQERHMGAKPKHSWKEAVLQYEREKSGKRSWRMDLRWIKFWGEHFEKVEDLCEINRTKVATIIEARPGVSLKEGTSANTSANRAIAMLRGMLRLAEIEWEWIDRAPRLRTYKEAKHPPRALTVEEWRKIEPVLADYWRLPAKFALATGLREARVFGLRWDDLAKLDRAYGFEGHGNKGSNCIPLNQTALDVIEECKRLPVRHATHVFHCRGNPMRSHDFKAWRLAFTKTGVEYARWHDLRKTFNTWLYEADVPLEIRKQLMGHSTGDIQELYTKVRIEKLRPFANLIDVTLSAQHKTKVAKKQKVA